MSLNSAPATAILRGQAKKADHRVLTINIPRSIKAYEGAIFLNTDLSIWLENARQSFMFIEAGMRNEVSFPIQFDASAKGVRTSVTFDLASTGAFGEAFVVIERNFLEQMPAVLQNPAVKPSVPANCAMITPVVRNYTDKAKTVEMRGKPLPAPRLVLKFNTGTFPERFFIKALVGKKKSTIYDWTTRNTTIVDGKPVDQFEEMLDPNGKPCDSTNIGTIIQRGATVRRIRAMSDGISISQYGASLRFTIFEMWLEPAPKSAVSIPDIDDADPVDE